MFEHSMIAVPKMRCFGSGGELGQSRGLGHGASATAWSGFDVLKTEGEVFHADDAQFLLERVEDIAHRRFVIVLEGLGLPVLQEHLRDKE